MMSFAKFRLRIRRKLLKIRLQPIRVFCFHQVSEKFEPDTMLKCDWTQIGQFKSDIRKLKIKYTFITLPEVTEHLRHDRFRFKSYAALTTDDGWSSVMNIIPWLAEQNVPITLFINPCYLDGKHYRDRDTEKYLSTEDLDDIVKEYHPFISIASHGWRHENCSKMSDKEFKETVNRAEAALMPFEDKIPYYAFTYGNYRVEQRAFVKEKGLIPVLMDGGKNYNDESSIHRELMDGGV